MTSEDLLCILPTDPNRGTSIPELARKLDCSEREIRAGLEELVVDQHRPIGTLPKRNGIWLCTTPEELDLARSHLRKKLVSLRRRMDGLEMARAEMCGNRLFL